MKNKINKSKVISFRLTEEQYKPYDELLKKSNKSSSEFFRELFLSKEQNIKSLIQYKIRDKNDIYTSRCHFVKMM